LKQSINMAVPVQHIEPSQLIPNVESGDSDQLAVLLETAQVLSENGDIQEALRWIRRAASLAAHEGRDDRALTLARAAADFATEAAAHAKAMPARKSVPPSLVGSTQVSASHAPTQVSPTTPSPAHSQAPSAPPPVHSVAVKTDGATSAPPSRVRTVSRSSSPPLTILPPAKHVEAPRNDAAPITQAELVEKLIAEGRAVRVVVKRSARDNELYVVRRQNHEKPPLGTRQAVLLLNDLDPEFFEK
jgi:hypothetical protein